VNTRQKFEKMAASVSREACAVPCSAEAYRDGLRTIIERLEDDLRASEESSR
jgi:hypothetical protein